MYVTFCVVCNVCIWASPLVQLQVHTDVQFVGIRLYMHVLCTSLQSYVATYIIESMTVEDDTVERLSHIVGCIHIRIACSLSNLLYVASSHYFINDEDQHSTVDNRGLAVTIDLYSSP